MPILRIVKLTFRKNNIENFLKLFDEKKSLIRNYPGCEHLELCQDTKDSRIFFTYSVWNLESSLENYRKSELFKSTWEFAKQLFDHPPEAWTLEKVHSS